MGRYGLLGSGISQSLSPGMFEASYGVAAYDIVDAPSFEEAFARFMADYDAVNVTMPYKVDAYNKADFRDESALAVGAANVLRKGPAGLEVFNTDYDAVKMILEENGLGEGSTVLVVGFGGAGKAAAMAACSAGAKVFVANRTVAAMSPYSSHFTPIPLEEIPSVLGSADCIIDALKVEVPALKDLSSLRQGALVLEANYMHPNIPQSDRYNYIGGRKWLLYQAVRGFELLTGQKPSVDRMSEFLGII